VLIEIRASGVCHTDEFTRSGADPEGLFPVIFGHEGAGTRRGCGTRRHFGKEGPFKLVTGRVWKGTAFGGARGRTDVPRIVAWYMEKKIRMDELITHVMPLEKINDTFDLARKGESIRSVVTF
jgi:Zn-dependent alcohol dehydrogenase